MPAITPSCSIENMLGLLAAATTNDDYTIRSSSAVLTLADGCGCLDVYQEAAESDHSTVCSLKDICWKPQRCTP